MATVRYGDVVPASDAQTLEERLKRNRDASLPKEETDVEEKDLNIQTKKRTK